MDSFFTQMPNVKLNLLQDNDEIKKQVFDFVSYVERVSPYPSQVKFFMAENEKGSFSARLEVSTSSFEILLTKKSTSVEALFVEFRESVAERLKPWLEGRFSAS